MTRTEALERIADWAREVEKHWKGVHDSDLCVEERELSKALAALSHPSVDTPKLCKGECGRGLEHPHSHSGDAMILDYAGLPHPPVDTKGWLSEGEVLRWIEAYEHHTGFTQHLALGRMALQARKDHPEVGR